MFDQTAVEYVCVFVCITILACSQFVSSIWPIIIRYKKERNTKHNQTLLFSNSVIKVRPYCLCAFCHLSSRTYPLKSEESLNCTLKNA